MRTPLHPPETIPLRAGGGRFDLLLWGPFVLAVVLMACLFGLVWRHFLVVSASSDLRKRSHEVLLRLEDLDRAMVDAHSAGQEYVISGSGSPAFESGRSRGWGVAAALAVVRSRLVEGTREPPEVQRLVRSIGALEDWNLALLECRETAGFEATRDRVNSGQGVRLLTEARRQIEEIEAEQHAAVARADERVRGMGKRLRLSFGLLSACSLGLVVAGGRMIRSQTRRRSEAERELSFAASLQNTLLDAASFGLISTDRDGRVTTFSRGAEQILGYGMAEVVSVLTVQAWHTPSELDRRAAELSRELGVPVDPGVECLLAKARLGPTDRGEWTLVRKNGTTLVASITVAGLRDSKDALMGFVLILVDLTESRRADAAVLRERERFELAARGAVDGLWDWDMVTGRDDFSDRWCEMLGYTREELPPESRTWEQLVHPDDLDRVFSAVRAHCEHRHPYDLEYRMRHKAGGYRWFRVSGQAQWDAAGRPIRMAGSLSDITPRKRAEEALRRSKMRLQAIADHIPAQVALVTADERYEFINAECERWFGRPRGRILGRTMREVHGESVYRTLAEHVAGALAGRTVDFEFEAERAGASRLLRITLTPEQDASGRSLGFYVLGLDLTEHRRAEERFRLVVEAAPSAMLMVDRDGLIRLVNSRAEELFGYARSEMAGRPIEMLIPPRPGEDHPFRREGFESDAALRPAAAGPDLRGVRKNGEEVPIEIGLNPLRMEEGTFVLASILDITRRRREEQAMRDSLAEKEILLREIHHRVKNNMQVISSLLQLQAGYVEDARLRGMFEDCQSRVRVMAAIHEQLYRSPSLACIDFGQQISELAEMLMRSFGAVAGGRVRLLVDADSVALGLDVAIPLGLVINELVTNSLKYAFPGDRQGTLRVSLKHSGTERLALTVEDDGVGLPSGVEPGTGRSLGLAMIRNLTRQLSGTLQFRGSPGVRVTVEFPIPAASADRGTVPKSGRRDIPCKAAIAS